MSDFKINPNKLDQEWIRQPALIEKHLIDAADKRLALDEAKNRLAVIEANLDQAIRDDPIRYQLSKITEGAVAKAIILQDEYQAALKEQQTAKHDYDIAWAACTALDHKKKGLEDLVKLHGQQYFSTPQAEPEELSSVTKDTVRSKGGVRRRKRERVK